MDVQLTTQMGRLPPQLPPADRFHAGVLRKVTEAGQQIAQLTNQAEVNTAHLVWAIGQHGDEEVRQLLEQYHLGPAQIEAELERQGQAEDRNQVFVGQATYSTGVQAALSDAADTADRLGESHASFGHILLSLLVSGELSILLARVAEAQHAARKELEARLARERKPLRRSEG